MNKKTTKNSVNLLKPFMRLGLASAIFVYTLSCSESEQAEEAHTPAMVQTEIEKLVEKEGDTFVFRGGISGSSG